MANHFDSAPSLAMIELSSIARGFYLSDVIQKKAPVKVLASQPVSSGKHVVLFCGDEASVLESYQAAIAEADGCLLKDILITSVHHQLSPFLESLWSRQIVPSKFLESDSVAFVESSHLAAAVVSADRALKTAAVCLVRLQLGQGIGGKAFYAITGDQADVEASAEAAREALRELDSLIRVDIVVRPDFEVITHYERAGILL